MRLALLRAFAFIGSPWRRSFGLPVSSSPRVLLMRPDHIGDLLFTTPTIRTLRQALPAAHLAVLVGSWGMPVIENNPRVDERLACEFPGFSRQRKDSWWAPYRRLLACARRLRSERYDVALILRFDHWWGALLAYLADIPCRIGYAIPECSPFLTHAVPYESQRHEVLQNQTLAEQVLLVADHVSRPPGISSSTVSAMPLEFFSQDDDTHQVEGYLQARGWFRKQPLVVIHPGAGAPVKQWRPDGFAEVANELQRQYKATIVLTGSSSELDLAWTIAAQMDTDPIVACGDTTLGQLATLFQLSQLVIGPDSGPLHLAVAVGTPTVHLYGPVDPAKFGPWGPATTHRVLVGSHDCIPCNRLDYTTAELPEHPCVREIEVSAVLGAARQLLDQVDTSPDIV